jgi:hypothetical protein
MDWMKAKSDRHRTMNEIDASLEARLTRLWNSIDRYEPDAFVAAGLTGLRRRRATIQLASSLRACDLGREREAVSVSLTALSKYLPRYNRSLERYASAIAEGVGER